MEKRKKSRRKSTLMLVLILAIVLVVGCIGGLTVAKYVASGSGSDSARVAKFGVTLSGGGDAFAKEYPAGASATVKSNVDVVAPGTSGSFTAVSLSGTPEVKVTVTNNAEVTLTGWTVNSTYYCPIKITVGSTSYNGMSYDSAAKFEEAVEAAINAFTATYDAGTDLSTKSSTGAITWEWAFSGGTGQTDAKDTALAGLSTAPTIEITNTVTVTQVD